MVVDQSLKLLSSALVNVANTTVVTTRETRAGLGSPSTDAGSSSSAIPRSARLDPVTNAERPGETI